MGHAPREASALSCDRVTAPSTNGVSSNTIGVLGFLRADAPAFSAPLALPPVALRRLLGYRSRARAPRLQPRPQTVSAVGLDPARAARRAILARAPMPCALPTRPPEGREVEPAGESRWSLERGLCTRARVAFLRLDGKKRSTPYVRVTIRFLVFDRCQNINSSVRLPHHERQHDSTRRKLSLRVAYVSQTWISLDPWIFEDPPQKNAHVQRLMLDV
jgi:hypothetical protein